MFSKPRIGLLILNYNEETYILRALESIRNQVTPFDQIVFADDGSTDGSFNTAKEFFEESKIEVEYSFGENLGTFENVKRGLNLVKTDYVIFLAADDKLFTNASNTIRKTISGAIKWDCIVTTLHGTSENGELEIAHAPKFTGIKMLDKFMISRQNLNPGPGAIYKTKTLREALFEFELRNYLWEDWLIFALLSKRNIRIMPSGKAYYIYLPNEESVSRQDYFSNEIEKTTTFVTNLEIVSPITTIKKFASRFPILMCVVRPLGYRILYMARHLLYRFI
jgi:glycosyltransferase involved in cell wall biosynthesis